MVKIHKMEEAFKDPAVPDGAGTMSDDWLETGAGSGSAGSSAGSGTTAEWVKELEAEQHKPPEAAERPPELSYAAICDHYEHGGEIWEGEHYTSQERAEADIVQHMGQFPGHEPRLRSW